MARDIAGIHTAGGEFRIGQHAGMEREIRGHAFDARVCDRAAQALQRLGAIDTVRDDLAQQRIVERRHARAGLDVRIDPHARARRPARLADQSRAGREIA